MINKTFALGTWEIHLQTRSERTMIASRMKTICKYIDTAVNYNNDYLITRDKGYKIISKIAPCHNQFYDLYIDNHIKCLGRDKIDIMLIHSSRGDWQSLAKRMAEDKRFSEIGVSNFSLDEIEEYNKLLGHYPAYNEIEINPYYTDLKTIKFCNKHGIKIIAYGVFGGKYRAMTYISRFSLPYLIQYAGKFADIVILKPESDRHVTEMIDVVLNYVEDDMSDIKMSKKLNDKSVVPMVYDAPTLIKKCMSFKTYNCAVGQNTAIRKYSTKILDDKPIFEMLGDYMTYLRYKYCQDYLHHETYKYDILIGDNGNMYAVYLYDENGNISKINTTNNIELVEISEVK